MSLSAQLNHLLAREPLHFNLPDLEGKRLLVTGSGGFLGTLVTGVLQELGAHVVPCETITPGLMSTGALDAGVMHDNLRWHAADCDAAIHLAAHKHAPAGEQLPAEVARLNIEGTARVARAMGPRPWVLASTCKATDPCTAYGASKLIAERIALNEPEARVVRLVNVLDSSGSVLRLWRELPLDEPLPVTMCNRFWITPLEACQALLEALRLEPGIYAPNVLEDVEPVEALAERAYPGREQRLIPLRRGDRVAERVVAEYEQVLGCESSGLVRILPPWPFED